MSEDQESKTEEGTAKKLQDAISSGNVPFSREAPVLASLAAMFVTLAYILPAKSKNLASALMYFVDDPAGWRFETLSDVFLLLSPLILAAADFLWPIIALMMAAGLTASISQNGLRLLPERLNPDLGRLSLIAGFSRVFGLKGFVEFLKNLVKLFAIGIVTGLILNSQLQILLSAMFTDISGLPSQMLFLASRLVGGALVLMIFIGGVDIVWTRISWMRDQRMSRQEIKEEIRQSEGDPLVKMRLRSLRLQRARKRMLNSVPRATMVVANPTHYAVALRYVPGETQAPLVVAKGADLLALRIREIAEQNSIPVIEDKPLARSLYEVVTVDQTIPPQFYRAVAELVHFLQQKKRLGLGR